MDVILKKNMFWTEEHNNMLCREILAVNPFTGTRKGTLQRGVKWKEIDTRKFKIDTRAVRDRHTLFSPKLRKKLKEAEALTLNDWGRKWLCEKEYESDAKQKEKDQEKQGAEDIRITTMERLEQTQKRKGNKENEGKATRKRRSNGTDTLMYLREKNEMQQEIRKEEVELKQKTLELQEKKQ